MVKSTCAKGLPMRAAAAGRAPSSCADGRRTLSRRQARRVYDAAGVAVDDAGSGYGRAAVAALRARMQEARALEGAARVLEVGCGSGRLAERLMTNLGGDGGLREGCVYACVDQSSVQLRNACRRLGAEAAEGQGDYRGVLFRGAHVAVL